jgi:hypothetical protein
MKDFDDLRNPSPYDPVEPEPDQMDPEFRTDLRQASDFELRQAEQGSSKVSVQNAIRYERYKREQMNNLGSKTQFESDVVDGPGIESDPLNNGRLKSDIITDSEIASPPPEDFFSLDRTEISQSSMEKIVKKLEESGDASSEDSSSESESTDTKDESGGFLSWLF